MRLTEVYTILIPVGIGILAYLAGFLDLIGSLAAIFFGSLITVASVLGYFLMPLSFMIVGSLFTLYKRDYKKLLGVAEPEHGKGINPVIANGIIPTFFAVLGKPYLLTGALSAALADTLATEIGVLHKKPVMIHTRWEVKPGTRGAVSWLGELAALGGALVMAFASWALLRLEISLTLAIAITAGLVGCNFDSLLGATVRFLSKHEINLLSTLLGAAVGGAFILAW